MPFVQRVIEPKYLSRTSLFDENGRPKVYDEELVAVANNTLSNALRQLASVVLVAHDIFTELGNQLGTIQQRSEQLKKKISAVENKVEAYDPKKVPVPESDICTFAQLKTHYQRVQLLDTTLFGPESRPSALKALYESASKTPVHLMRQLDRWRRDGHRSSQFFLCTPVLGGRRRKIRNRVDIDIETRLPAAVEDLRRWTSDEALGDVTVTPDGINRIPTNNNNNSTTVTDGEATIATSTNDRTTNIGSDDEGIGHKLPSPEEQLQVVALKFPAEVVAVDISGKNFDRMAVQRRSLMHHSELDGSTAANNDSVTRRRNRTRRPRSRRRNTLAGTDQKEIQALTNGNNEELTAVTSSTLPSMSTANTKPVPRSKSSDILRPLTTSSTKSSPENKLSAHFNTLKAWGKSRYDKFMNKEKTSPNSTTNSDEFTNYYETVKRKRDLDRKQESLRRKERNISGSVKDRSGSISSSEKSVLPTSTLSSVMNIAVKLRESSAQRRQKRKEEPHSSSGNWSASSESGRASIGSEIQPKSTTSAATSSNSLNVPSSVNSRRKFAVGSVTSEGTLTPDIIHDLHEDETSSVYSCDTEGYYTSFHMDSGLKTLKEEEVPSTPLHSTNTTCGDIFNKSTSAENEYELFGKGSTSTTTSSAGTICTTLRASDSNRSLIIGPAVPERKSSLLNKSGTIKRSPNAKPTVVALVHKSGDVSPDSGHNTSSPVESDPLSSPISSEKAIIVVEKSCSEFEFSESSDMEGADRIERIRVKTTINSSRIPSMCVITPLNSDDDSESNNLARKLVLNLDPNLNNLNGNPDELKSTDSDKENCNIRLINTPSDGAMVINVNPQSGYATVEKMLPKQKSYRAASPSGGALTVINNNNNEEKTEKAQPLIKASLMPLNTMLGKLRNFTFDRKPKEDKVQVEDPAGEYVTIADVRNNNKDATSNLATVLSGKIKDAEYVSLNELPLIESDSLERKRKGARVTLDAEGKVVYSSNSLKRKKPTSFEPGPFIKSSETSNYSPLPARQVKVRPIVMQQHQQQRPLSPANKIVIKAGEMVRLPANVVAPSARPMSPRGAYVNVQEDGAIGQKTEDQLRRTPSPIQTYQQYQANQSSRTVSPVSYPITTQASAIPLQPDFVKGPAAAEMYNQFYQNHLKQHRQIQKMQQQEQEMQLQRNKYLPEKFNYENRQELYERPFYSQDYKLSHPQEYQFYPANYQFQNNQFYPQNHQFQLRSYSPQQYHVRSPPLQHHSMQPMNYNTLPVKKSQQFYTNYHSQGSPERSVTPDITRGLGPQFDSNSMDRKQYRKWQYQPPQPIPVDIPKIVPYFATTTNADNCKISPIDPRSTSSANKGFQTSTPGKAAVNLENKLLSPKKSTMTNDELYAIIHKSKKKMNIQTDEEVNLKNTPPVENALRKTVKSPPPESGYLNHLNQRRSRLSWSPTKGEYVDFTDGIDMSPAIPDVNRSPPNDSRSRQSWACSDRKTNQTSRLDFKKLLLQKSNFLTNPKKLSAVEQLKLSKQETTPLTKQEKSEQMSILELSGSPRSLVQRKFQNANLSPTKVVNNSQKPKILSPRSQWRFANPRTDVLSSTILEDCREDESSPNNSMEKKSESAQIDNSPKSQFQNEKLATSTPISSKQTQEQKQEIIERKNNTSLKTNDYSQSKQSSPPPTIKKDSPFHKESAYMSAYEKLQAQRAQFFNYKPQYQTSSHKTNSTQSVSPKLSPKNSSESEKDNIKSILNGPTLETAF